MVEMEMFLDGESVAVQRYATREIFFGASIVETGNTFKECPETGCRVDRMVVYHASAINPARSSAIGTVERGRCRRENAGAGFSLDALTVSVNQAVPGGLQGTPSSFEGYCTGAPGGDYTHCANQDVCYVSPSAAEGG